MIELISASKKKNHLHWIFVTEGIYIERLIRITLRDDKAEGPQKNKSHLHIFPSSLLYDDEDATATAVVLPAFSWSSSIVRRRRSSSFALINSIPSVKDTDAATRLTERSIVRSIAVLQTRRYPSEVGRSFREDGIYGNARDLFEPFVLDRVDGDRLSDGAGGRPPGQISKNVSYISHFATLSVDAMNLMGKLERRANKDRRRPIAVGEFPRFRLTSPLQSEEETADCADK